MTCKLPDPIAWMHDETGRVDVIHSEVKNLWLKMGQPTGFFREKTPCKVEHYTTPLYTAQALRDVLEQAAGICDAIGMTYRDLYKGHTEPIDHDRRYDPHTDGMSDGAWECEDAIRTMIGEIK